MVSFLWTTRQQVTELLASTTTAWLIQNCIAKSYTVSTSFRFGWFPATIRDFMRILICEALHFFIFIAAFWSRPIVIPQLHCIVRIDKSFISGWRVPQQWHIWLDGNHLSTFMKCFPRSKSLYSSMDKNIPYPLSKVALPLPKPLFAIERIFRFSTQTTSYWLAISVDCLCRWSNRWLAICLWILFILRSCLI